MTEIDIWIDILKKIKCQFIEELCSKYDNVLIYEYIEDGLGLSNHLGGYIKISIHFDLKSGIISNVFFKMPWPEDRPLTKQSFKLKLKDLFREATLNFVLNN